MAVPGARDVRSENPGTRTSTRAESPELLSGVPLATFGACDPAIEAALLDDVVGRIFLRHIAKDREEDAVTPEQNQPPKQRRDRPVTRDDLLTLAATLPEVEATEPPPLDAGLDTERLWILADLSCHATGIARQRATAEIRRLMVDLQAWAGTDRASLAALASTAPQTPEHDTVVLRILRDAARRALFAGHETPTKTGTR